MDGERMQKAPPYPVAQILRQHVRFRTDILISKRGPEETLKCNPSLSRREPGASAAIMDAPWQARRGSLSLLIGRLQ